MEEHPRTWLRSGLVPVALVGLMTAVGLALALGWVGWIDNADEDGFETDQEIGVGLLTGGLIGGALLLIDERRESDRASRDDQLAALQMRHSIITAVTIKDDLVGVVLAGHDLTGLVVSGRDLTGANLSYANLTDARFGQACMVDVWLRGANLTRAVLGGVDLTGADLSGADLTDAILSGANLRRAKLDRVRLDGVVTDDQTVWPDGFEPFQSATG